MAERVNMHRESMTEEEYRSGTAALWGRNEAWGARVHFVAKNCQEMHQVRGSLNDLSRSVRLFLQSHKTLTQFSHPERNFKSNLITEFSVSIGSVFIGMRLFNPFLAVRIREY